MPTPEEIKKIAEEFAEYKLNKQYSSFPENLKQRVFSDTANIITEWLKFLSKDYCIVPKSELKEIYACYKQHEEVSDKKGLHEAMLIARGSQATMRDIFGKSLFEEVK